MRRTNTFELRAFSQRERCLLLELLDASAACYNEVNYERRQAFFDVRENAEQRVPVSELRTAVEGATTQEKYRQRYKQVLSSSTPQQLVQKNWSTWKSFFKLLSKYRDPENETVTDKPSPPGYWKDGEQRVLHTVIRNDQYTLELGDRSRVEIPVGMELKEAYGLGHHERLRLEVRGKPHWTGKQGRLEIVYDRDAESFTAHQSVGDEKHPPHCRQSTTSSFPTTLATSSRGEGTVAAVDIGANNLAAVTTSTGQQLLFHGRPLFERFHEYTRRIAHQQSELPEEQWSSPRIRELYRRRDAQRDHAQDALVRHLGEWLANHDVDELIVGKLGDVCASHWSATVNEKTHLFWAHGRFRRRLDEVLGDEYGITVREESEAGTSSKCPTCESTEVHRNGDLLHCLDCGTESHSDLAASVNFLREQADEQHLNLPTQGPMARPVASRENTTEDGHHDYDQTVVPRLEWDDHGWRQPDHSTKEDPTNQSTTPGNLPSGSQV
ncbi:RNA-guided endonuclease InsQ/TnpB family protein [Halospeciosus flavus]|uniref:RNA-guided endonuclease InsQ/TnpB family protein n=1 Tax=Halospeciosus flavus TaxID=3032283 RepID=A0ABD5Z3H8_9EURY|nr:transposase [Halospeciosus flavus]